MAADFNTPTIAGESYVDILSGIRAKFEVVSTMSYGDAVQGSIPTNAVQFLDGRLQKWDGSSFQNAPISITGGGTGGSTAAGARAALAVPQAGTLSGQVRTNGESDLLYVPTSRQVATSGALTGGGTLDSDVTVSIADASTSVKGAVQLYDGLNSASTSLALTAAQGKILNDRRTAIYATFSQLKFSLKADWNGSSYSAVNLTGDQAYWGIQSFSTSRIGTGNFSVSISSGVGDYTVQATALNSGQGINVTIGNITSTSFQVYCRRSDTNALIDSDVFLTITKASILG